MSNCEDNLRKLAFGWVNDAYTVKISEIPKILYHYTDAAGLNGTLKSGRLWATETRFLNDTEERRLGLSAAKAHVQAEIGALQDETLRPFYDAILHYQKMLAPSEYYIFSLSTERDDLSQWRGYAREGQGFTLGFDARQLFKCTEPEETPIGLARVEYDAEKQSTIIKSVLADIKDELKKGLEAAEEPQYLCDQAAALFDAVVDARAAVNKHGSFRGEREWRIVGQFPREDPDKLVKVRVSGTRLVKYVELDICGSEGRLPIMEIGVGPGFSGEEHIDAVKALCRDAGYPDLPVYCADTPYRRN